MFFEQPKILHECWPWSPKPEIIQRKITERKFLNVSSLHTVSAFSNSMIFRSFCRRASLKRLSTSAIFSSMYWFKVEVCSGSISWSNRYLVAFMMFASIWGLVFGKIKRVLAYSLKEHWTILNLNSLHWIFPPRSHKHKYELFPCSVQTWVP